uniref:Uncharacterized protein n=1 Tax=Mastacembelus armatus TaxID=205130 RepID=A0A3Q3KHF6_9TELE
MIALLRLLPSARCLFDEPVQVKVEGLRSRQVVTMKARSTDEKGVVFSSSATYRADGSREIDLLRDPSLSGSYVGVEPMGLLWSMKADALHKKFQKPCALNPHVVKFSVHEEDREDRMLAEVTNERLLIGNGVSRVPVKGRNFQGVLFTPPEGPFPAVLDLCTLMCEKRASLLANKGFVVLTWISSKLQSFNTKSLFYLHSPIPEVKNIKGVGIISRSKGGEIALSLAAFVPGVEAVVWINGCSAVAGVPLYYKNQQIIPPIPFDLSKIILTESGASMINYTLENPVAEKNKGSLVPIEQAKGRFLFVASEDDLCLNSKVYMEQIVERLKHHGKENFETMSYPGSGHMLEPPYGPYCTSSFHGVVPHVVLWGGEARTHAAAEVHLWSKIQEFFRTHLIKI